MKPQRGASTRQRPARAPRDGERVVEQMMDIDGVAERLFTTTRHIRRLVSERRIPFNKVGGKLRFDPAVIEEWVAASLVPPRHEPYSPTPIFRSATSRARRRNVT